jgi:prepilin-type N-terminal cleavage/methylation domain-containing protein
MIRINRAGRKGVTLIELMIALAISAAVVAGIYRTFLTQQHSYEVQDDVMDMQQNVRAALNEMTREIRMVGFGNIQSILPVTINGTTYNNIINPDTPSPGALTILAGIGGSATLTGFTSPNVITVDKLSTGSKVFFDTGDRRFISIAGSDSFAITGIAAKTLTLNGSVNIALKTDGAGNVTVPVSVFAIRAITYVVVPDASGTPVLRRNENLGGGNQPLADGIGNLAFDFFDDTGNLLGSIPGNAPAAGVLVNIRRIQVTVTAQTKYADPQMKVGDGLRRRTVVSNVLLRNMGI